MCLDKYENHYLSINVNYFVAKGKDKLIVTLNNGDSFTLELGKSFKQHTHNFYSISYTATIHKLGYYQFFSAYPLTPEQYNSIKDIGIKQIEVEGIYMIELR